MYPLDELCLKFKESPELRIIGSLTLYRNVKDTEVTTVHIGKKRETRFE